MTIRIASDIHGAYRELGDALQEDDTLILCGDYLRFLEFETLDGILADLIPRDQISAVLRAIDAGDVEQAKQIVAEVFAGRRDLMSRIRELADRAYKEMFSLIPCETYLIYGNVDIPDLLMANAGDHHHLMDGDTAIIEGKVFGFVSGMPPTAYSFGMPGDVSEREYLIRLDAVGATDVLVTHCPPAISKLTFDKVAKRDEEGSKGLLRHLEDFLPSVHYFGHVHNPISRRVKLERTLCVNAGHFANEHVVLNHDEIASEDL